MGRKKKKPFIDKKEAHTYHLVPRSQRDPLAGDANESQYVLVSTDDKELRGEEKGPGKDCTEEQRKHGIYYEDDYDYLQHVRAPTTAVLEPIMLGSAEKKERDVEGGIKLPDAVFGAEVNVEGHMDRVLPITGPCPNWDPEVVEALDNAEICDETGSQLEDDFVMLANAGEPGLPVYVTNQQDDDTNWRGPWWSDRVDFDCSKQTPGSSSDSDDDDAGNESTSSEAQPGIGSLQDDILEKKTAQFTEYSMTSSVVPRSEALTLLDDHFEEFMVKYSNDQLGAGDEEVGREDSGDGQDRRREYDQMLLQSAMEDFVRNYREDGHCDAGDGERGGKAGGGRRDLSEHDAEKDEEREEGNSEITSSEEEEEPLTKLGFSETKAAKWDCESILSTYSNLYNHPTKITEPANMRHDHGNVRLSKKTGIPLGVIPGPSPKENLPKKVSITRPKNEGQEERKERKTELKEERKQRRLAKKANKVVFRSEGLRQERCLLNNSTPATAM